ncbi:MAG: YezD family protein [Bryobacteraceae bacterium]|jgi:hypothetical protein
METLHKLARPAATPDQERLAHDEVLRTLREVRFGTVQLTIHDGRVVEIQKTERIRPASCCRPQ